jgi:hypothetical protein
LQRVCRCWMSTCLRCCWGPQRGLVAGTDRHTAHSQVGEVWSGAQSIKLSCSVCVAVGSAPCLRCCWGVASWCGGWH